MLLIFLKKGFYDGFGSTYEWKERWESMYLAKKIEEIEREKSFLKFLKEKLISIDQPYNEFNIFVKELNL